MGRSPSATVKYKSLSEHGEGGTPEGCARM